MMLKKMTVFNVQFVSIASSACLVKVNYLNTLLMTTLGPIVLSLLIGLYLVVSVAILKYNNQTQDSGQPASSEVTVPKIWTDTALEVDQAEDTEAAQVIDASDVQIEGNIKLSDVCPVEVGYAEGAPPSAEGHAMERPKHEPARPASEAKDEDIVPSIDFEDFYAPIVPRAPIVPPNDCEDEEIPRYGSERNREDGDRNELSVDEKIAHIRHSCTTFFFALTYFVFPSTSLTILRALQCDRDIADNTGEAYLRIDYGIDCNGDTYVNFMEPFAIIMIFVYPLGIPSLLVSPPPPLLVLNSRITPCAN